MTIHGLQKYIASDLPMGVDLYDSSCYGYMLGFAKAWPNESGGSICVDGAHMAN